MIYALSEIYDITGNEQFLEWIDTLCQILCSRLGINKSFGHFSRDIDAIGGLSIGSAVLKDDYHYQAKKLVLNQLAQQGPNGEWRWVFSRKSGHYIPWRDITYTVHQMGMGPWPLSLFMTSFGWNASIEKAVEKGLSFISNMKAIHGSFIIRSFAGMSGVVYQKEQRSYELGLNLLGLISFLTLRGMHERKLTPSYEHLLDPSKIKSDYGITPIDLIRSSD